MKSSQYNMLVRSAQRHPRVRPPAKPLKPEEIEAEIEAIKRAQAERAASEETRRILAAPATAAELEAVRTLRNERLQTEETRRAVSKLLGQIEQPAHEPEPE